MQVDPTESRTYKVMDSINSRILKIEEVFLVIVTISLVGAIFIEVVCRYVFFISTAWAEELARYLFIAMTFLGASYAFNNGAHIEIDIASQVVEKSKIKNKAKVKLGFEATAIIGTLAFLLYFCKIFADYTLQIQKIGQLSPTMHMPMVYIYYSVLLGCVITVLHGIYMLYCIFTNKPLPKAR